jgi:hypothetical protein
LPGLIDDKAWFYDRIQSLLDQLICSIILLDSNKRSSMLLSPSAAGPGYSPDRLLWALKCTRDQTDCRAHRPLIFDDRIIGVVFPFLASLSAFYRQGAAVLFFAIALPFAGLARKFTSSSYAVFLHSSESIHTVYHWNANRAAQRADRNQPVAQRG